MKLKTKNYDFGLIFAVCISTKKQNNMPSILTGLFKSPSQYKNLEQDLENSGFEAYQYVIYKNPGNEGEYAASVELDNDNQAVSAEEVFNKHNAIKKFVFQDMNIIDALDYESIEHQIRIRTNIEIKDTPDIHIKTTSSGMDSEVKF